MRKGATTDEAQQQGVMWIVALRNEKGSYNAAAYISFGGLIVALRNEKGSYNTGQTLTRKAAIVALRNEKGSYN